MKKILGFIIVLLIGYGMIHPLLLNGYFPMHDDTQIARVVVMGRALREGQFPVRWVSDLGYGYGYPIFNFYGPLPYYAGGFFYALGLSGLTATKIMMGLGLILAGMTMYFSLAGFIGISGAILGATFYMYAPYHAVDAYVRGAVGEYWALAFLPLILWGTLQVMERKKTVLGILLGALATAGIILSHTILGYAGMYLIAILALVSRKRNIFLSIFIGLGLSAFFWLPAFFEMKYTNVASQISSTANFRDHYVCLSQLWNSAWGFGGSVKGCIDGLSFKIGKVHLLVGAIVLLGLVGGFIREKRGKTLALAGFAVTVSSVFLTLSISQPAWETLPLFSYIQYPWRFLAFAVFGLSLLIGQLVYMLKHAILRWLVVVVCVAAVLFVEVKRFAPKYIYERPTADFESVEEIRFRASKISDEYLPPSVPRPIDSSGIVRDTIPQSDDYTVEIQQQSDTYDKFGFYAKKQSSVIVRKAYFPGWYYVVNGKEVVPEVRGGLPVLIVPQGKSVVELFFRDTPVRTIANILSIVSVISCIYLYDQRKKIIA